MGIEAGQKAPTVALTDQNGNQVKLADFKGKRIVVHFFASG